MTLIDLRSTVMVVVLQGQFGDDLGPPARRRVYFKRPPQEGRALAHSEDPQARASRLLSLRDAVRIESDAVVANPQPNVAVEAAQGDIHVRRLRVLVGVGQRLLRDPVEGRLD